MPGVKSGSSLGERHIFEESNFLRRLIRIGYTYLRCIIGEVNLDVAFVVWCEDRIARLRCFLFFICFIGFTSMSSVAIGVQIVKNDDVAVVA